MKAYQPKNIKAHNQALLLEILKENIEPMTTRQLAERSHLSVVTINKLLPELIVEKMLLLCETPLKTGGRRAAAYKFNPQRQLFLINQFIEKAGRLIVNFYVVDLTGKIIAEQTTAAVDLPAFLETVAVLKTRFPAIVLVLSGIPGVEVKGHLAIMDHAPFKDLELNHEIYQKIGVAAITENDINAATFGCSSPAVSILAGIYFPQNFPPGAALVIQQQLFKGSHNLSGEIKHLPNLIQASFPLTAEASHYQLLQTTQSVTAMYDPDEIILFIPESWQNYIKKDQLHEELGQIFTYGVLPKLTITTDFSSYYLKGLIHLGLQKMTAENTAFKY